PERDPGPDPAEREKLDRVRGRLVRKAEVGHPLGGLPVGRARNRKPGEVALVVGGEDRDARLGELLRQQLERARLAGARRAGDQAVAVRRRERKADDRVARELSVVHAAAEVERRAFDRVAGGNRLGERGHRAYDRRMAVEAPTKLDAHRLRADFPIFEQQIHGKPLAFLDSAASSQKPRQVLDAMTRFYETSYANVHRG